MKKPRNRVSGAAPHVNGLTPAQRLRIIGGQWRGRQILYSGDLLTRPMKDNIREAVFNLVGGWIPGKRVFDLFAGTGAIGLEALSRGAAHATFVERHIPTARIVEQNVASLGAGAMAKVETADTFFWARQFLKLEEPGEDLWAVFCSPPYALYVDQAIEMKDLIDGFWYAAPDGSILVVEADSRFDPQSLPNAGEWRRRRYAPADIYVWRPKDTGRKV